MSYELEKLRRRLAERTQALVDSDALRERLQARVEELERQLAARISTVFVAYDDAKHTIGLYATGEAAKDACSSAMREELPHVVVSTWSLLFDDAGEMVDGRLLAMVDGDYVDTEFGVRTVRVGGGRRG